MGLKALAEIYNIHSFAQLCNLIFYQNCTNYIFLLKFNAPLFHWTHQRIPGYVCGTMLNRSQKPSSMKLYKILEYEELLEKISFDTAKNGPRFGSRSRTYQPIHPGPSKQLYFPPSRSAGRARRDRGRWGSTAGRRGRSRPVPKEKNDY